MSPSYPHVSVCLWLSFSSLLLSNCSADPVLTPRVTQHRNVPRTPPDPQTPFAKSALRAGHLPTWTLRLYSEKPCSPVPTLLTPLGHRSQGEASPPPSSSSSTRKTRSTHSCTREVAVPSFASCLRCSPCPGEMRGGVPRGTAGLQGHRRPGSFGPAGSETHPWEGMVDGRPRGSPERHRGWMTGGKASTPGSACCREHRAHGTAPSVQVLLQSQQQPRRTPPSSQGSEGGSSTRAFAVGARSHGRRHEILLQNICFFSYLKRQIISIFKQFQYV